MVLQSQPITLIVDGRKQESKQIDQIAAGLGNAQFSCNHLFIFTAEETLTSTEIILSNKSNSIVLFWLSPKSRLDLRQIETEWIGVIPRDTALNSTLPTLSSTSGLIPWLSPVIFPQETAIEVTPPAIAWLALAPLIEAALPWLIEPEDWTLLNVGRILEQQNVAFQWHAASVAASELDFLGCGRLLPTQQPVLAIVPHYRCEAWLSQCLRSLVRQTRPLDGIVVIDDGSAVPPIEIVEQFPQVTLLVAPVTVGPYRLVQQVIEMTNYWAYLFQDADDWSSCDRLETLLEMVNATKADLVGTQEIRVYEEDAKLSLGCYPLDVNAALAEKPGHPLLHPTSLVTRDLVLRLGGFATGLRFGGDTEFLLRASFIATIRNSPRFCYFRRKRPGSLITAPETGLDSPARQELLRQVKQRALMNRAKVVTGKAPDLTPLATAGPIVLQHFAGSPLG